MDKTMNMLRSNDKEMVELGVLSLLYKYLPDAANKIEEMLYSKDKEMVDLGIATISTLCSYEELILLTDKLPHFSVFLMQNIFEDKLEWEIRQKYISPFIKDPTKLLKLIPKI